MEAATGRRAPITDNRRPISPSVDNLPHSMDSNELERNYILAYGV